MEELVNAIRDRFKSPIFGRFLLSWCIYNWKIVYLTVFIGQDKIGCTKLDYIEQVLSQYNWTYGNLIVYPVLTTLGLILVEQSLIIGYNYIISRREIWWQKIRAGLSLITIYSTEEYNKIYEKYDTLKKQVENLKAENSNFLSAIEAYNKEKNDLSNNIILLNEEKADLKNKNNELSNQISILKEYKDKHVLSLYKKSIDNIFIGKWECKFSISNGTKRDELFTIKDGNQYWVNELLLRFIIKDYQFIQDEKYSQIIFSKCFPDNLELFSKVILVFNAGDNYFHGDELISPNREFAKEEKAKVIYRKIL